MLGLQIIFFCSGFAALIYQVVWQRVLFSLYGSNIESVTMVVTAFMLGLGLGSLAGGALSRNPRRSPLLLFAAVETSIGIFGAFSLPFFRWVGSFTLQLSPGATGLVTLLVLVLPTLLMGATLPLLVAHSVKRSGNVGQSIGVLYAVNTLGSALAALATVLVLFRVLGQSHTVRLAAAINLSLGVAVFVKYWSERSGSRTALVSE